jgi:quinoprotein glucose dehydrogenase
LIVTVLSVMLTATANAQNVDWLATGGDRGNSRYSTLAQINRGNVGSLRVAWTYRTGDIPANGRGEIQATPIVVDGILYTTTPAIAVVALRGDNGTPLWRFTPPAKHKAPPFGNVNRGVVYWADGDDKRILFTAGKHLYALDARTGRAMASFGDSGAVDLSKGLSRDIGEAYFAATSPGAIYKDLLIQGMRVGEDEGSAPGDVRAFDVRTGAIRWTFHTIPQPGEFGHETWPADAWKTAGGANSWAGMAVDTQRGIVYVPTGSATPDFYGGDRIGANLFANTLLALDAATGKRLWHFQAVHHDLWDRDLPAAPNLVTVMSGGRRTDAVAQITKQGYVFVFDRQTGAPLFPIEERPAPRSDLTGEQAWPTQPTPLKPPPFARQSDTLWKPPSLRASVLLPGFDGGGEWGGAAVDANGMLYVNATEMPWIMQMREIARLPAPTEQPRSGEEVYAQSCASCHGVDRRGNDRAPTITGTLQEEQLRLILQWGRGFMPSFARLPEAEKSTLVNYLLGRGPPKIDMAAHAREVASRSASSRQPALYEFMGYNRMRDSSGYPAIAPPWGTLTAIDLNTGEHRWRIPLGEYAAPKARGVPTTGTEQYGGPIVTAGGLIFIAATLDAKLRSLDAATGEILWETSLPAPGFATPATYMVAGKQYLVIAAGGGKIGFRPHDEFVAFALP